MTRRTQRAARTQDDHVRGGFHAGSETKPTEGLMAMSNDDQDDVFDSPDVRNPCRQR